MLYGYPSFVVAKVSLDSQPAICYRGGQSLRKKRRREEEMGHEVRGADAAAHRVRLVSPSFSAAEQLKTSADPID